MFGINYELVTMALQNEFVLGMFMLSIFGSIVFMFRGIFGAIKSILTRQLTVQTKVTNSDEHTFGNMTKWLSEIPGLSNRLRTFRVGMYHKNGKDHYFKYPGEGKHFFLYKSRPFMIDLDVETDKQGIKEIVTITTIGRSNEFLADMIDSFVKGDDTDSVNVYTYTYHWKLMTKRRLREWGSIFYNGTMKDDVHNDIQAFLDSEEWYHKHGVPYHRGYLFEGAPGTGKTSLIHGLASRFNYDIYSLDLAAIEDQSDFIDALRTAPRESFVLIEDIDAFEVTHSRESEEESNKISVTSSKLTLSGVLNSIDGLCSVDGRIIFMTTNHPDKLDTALVRPGRVDKRVTVGLPDEETIKKMYNHFIPTGVGVDAFVQSHLGKTAAEIQESLFKLS